MKKFFRFLGLELEHMHISDTSFHSKGFTHRELVELAGSAFHLGSVGAALLAALVVQGPYAQGQHAPAP